MASTIAGPLHAISAGAQGPVVAVFVHPNPLDSTCWLYQMDRYATWLQCVAVDLPGYGRSPRCTDAVTMTDIADAVWEAVDRRAPDATTYALIGCSVGAAVVQHMIHQRAPQVPALVLSGIGYSRDKPFVEERIGEYRRRGLDYRYDYALELFSPSFRTTPLAHWFARTMAERNHWADVDSIVHMFRALGVPDPEHLQADVAAPVLIVSGTEDRAHAGAHVLRDRFADCRLEAVEGAGHAVHMERPDAFDAAVLPFLRANGILP